MSAPVTESESVRFAGGLPELEPWIKATFGRRWWREFAKGAEAERLRASELWLDTGNLDGGGAPVVLVPGYMASNNSMQLIARWLSARSFDVTFAPVGRNAWSSADSLEAIVGEIDRRGAGLTLIGHSRGGQQARVAASRRHASIDRLITLGSPVRYARPPFFPIRSGIEIARLAHRAGLGPQTDPVVEAAYERDLLESRLPAAITWNAVWSTQDGIVQWQACVDLEAVNVSVNCSHLGLTGSVASFDAILSALS